MDRLRSKHAGGGRAPPATPMPDEAEDHPHDQIESHTRQTSLGQETLENRNRIGDDHHGRILPRDGWVVSTPVFAGSAFFYNLTLLPRPKERNFKKRERGAP